VIGEASRGTLGQSEEAKYGVGMRRHTAIMAVAIAGVVLTAVVFYGAVWEPNGETSLLLPETFELSADAREITVAYCGSTADRIATQSVREDDQAVTVSVRMRRERDVFQNGSAVKVTFPLTAPLGGRVVQDEAGAAIPSRRPYVCPG
jgi:hypothetical protein